MAPTGLLAGPPAEPHKIEKGGHGVRFHQPATLDEALGLLADNDGARCLAGGQTLVAMMNAELIEPTALVSLKKIPDLDRIDPRPDGTLVIGAMATHDAVAEFSDMRPAQAIVSKAAAVIAHPAIRNMGTIGGAIAHADPAADYPAALVAADAVVEVNGPDGPHDIAAGDFFVDYLEPALAPGEIVAAVRLPPGPDEAICAYEKVTRVEGDYAILSLALVVAGSGGVCGYARLALGSAGPAPVRVAAAEARLIGSALGDQDADAAAALLVAAADPLDDTRASSQYRLRIIPRLLRRALALARAGGA